MSDTKKTHQLAACFCSSKGNSELYLSVQWVQDHAVDAGQKKRRRPFPKVRKIQVHTADEANLGSRENKVRGKISYFFCGLIFEKINVLLSQVCCTPEIAESYVHVAYLHTTRKYLL